MMTSHSQGGEGPSCCRFERFSANEGITTAVMCDPHLNFSSKHHFELLLTIDTINLYPLGHSFHFEDILSVCGHLISKQDNFSLTRSVISDVVFLVLT